MIGRLLGYVMVGVGCVIIVAVVYIHSGKSNVPLIFSPSQLLEATWRNYKNSYVMAGTYRTVDTSRGRITTSEGQSYTLLRAVWMGDKPTFDGTWHWTEANLEHSEDALFA